MVAAFYPSVKVVQYRMTKAAPPEDGSTRALEFLQEADEEFAGMLDSDLYLLRVYAKYRSTNFWAKLSAEQTTADDSRKRTTLRFIVRSLKLRSNFAILQHERLCRNMPYILGGPEEEIRVKRQVWAQLFHSIQILKEFKDHPDIAAAITEMVQCCEDPQAYSKVTRVPDD